MENLVISLLLVVGLALGVLVTLIIDGRFWSKQVATAVTENRQLQQKVRSLASRLAAAQTQVKRLGDDLDETSRQIEALTNLSQIMPAVALRLPMLNSHICARI